MGNDPDCGRWIRAFREAPPEGEAAAGGSTGGAAAPAGAATDRVARLTPDLVSGSADALVIFTPSGRRGRFAEGTTVLDAARSLGVDIDSVCGGRGICGRCQVEPGIGTFAKHGITSGAGHLSPPGAVEAEYDRATGWPRIAASAARPHVLGDVLIDVPPESQVHRQVVRKGVDVRDFQIDPVVRLHYVEVTPPELASPSGDLARLLDALEREWHLTGLEADLEVVRALQPALEAGGYKVTVAVHDGRG